jgi:CRP/FNR family transcriptional regulator, nitrogen fixation regulation protein
MQTQTVTEFGYPRNRSFGRVAVQVTVPEVPAHKQPHRGKLSGTLEMMGAAMEFPRNGEIYGEGEAADYVYKVMSGAVRISKVLDDGRRQINAFHLAGEVFGFEVGEDHQFSAEAVTSSKILIVKRSALIALATRQNEVANELWTLTARKLEHVQNLMITLGRKNAHERVAAFLLEMAGRAADKRTIELPMPRQDIADYLGLTIETVSRTFTQLENEAAIELTTSRRVVLRNRGALNRLNA